MRLRGAVLLIALVIAACAPGAVPAASPLTVDVARARILSEPLGDVRTGDQFRLGQFSGGVTVIVLGAVW